MRTSETTEKLLAALAKAQGELRTVAKSGQNREQGYSYASLEDYFEALRPVMAANGLGVVVSIPVRDGMTTLHEEGETREEREDAFGAPRYLVAEEWTTKSGGRMRALRLGLEVRLFHASGEWLEVDMIGEAADSSDKRIWKVLTNARKYALANLFNVATGDDAEKDSPEGRADRPSQAPTETNRPRRSKARTKRESSASPPSPTFAAQDQRHGIARAIASRIDGLTDDDEIRKELMAEARLEILTAVGAINPDGDLDSTKIKAEDVPRVLELARTWSPAGEEDAGAAGDPSGT